MHIKKGDTVIVLSGDDKGKTGKVLIAFPTKGKVIVEGINTVKKHERARTQGGKGQVVDRAMPMHVSKLRSTSVAKKEAGSKKAAKPAAKKATAKTAKK